MPVKGKKAAKAEEQSSKSRTASLRKPIASTTSSFKVEKKAKKNVQQVAPVARPEKIDKSAVRKAKKAARKAHSLSLEAIDDEDDHEMEDIQISANIVPKPAVVQTVSKNLETKPAPMPMTFTTKAMMRFRGNRLGKDVTVPGTQPAKAFGWEVFYWNHDKDDRFHDRTFLPAMEFLVKLKFKPRNGVGAVIISPNRETASQVYSVAKELFKHAQQTLGLVLEGSTKRSESDKLIKGVNLLIGTPAAILDHLEYTPGFEFKSTGILVVDEADTVCQSGSLKDVRKIRKILTTVRTLASTLLANSFVTISNVEPESTSTDKINSHSHLICTSQLRFLVLFTFLSKNLPDKKIIVLFSSSESVKFHAEMLANIDIQVSTAHGDQNLQRRTEVFSRFRDAEKGFLFCTNVTARDFDIPPVDWLIQYEPPDSVEFPQSGQALLFLLPHEQDFLKKLKSSGVSSGEFSISANRAEKLQAQIEKSVEKNYMLYKSALDAYRTYVQTYASNLLKKYFDVDKLDVPKVAKAFGFNVAPRVNFKAQ
ncbi:P-loop containing nucleoside triphosphate hydrolase protein [Chytridium lagenaria]|nr:P-loop containing nucleoside triphosphate hydrolase protein [Chytridium lagenaria]